MKAFRELGSLPREVWVLSGVALVNRAGTMVLPFLALWLTSDLGVPASHAGLVVSAYGAAALVAAPIGGRMADRAGTRRLMLVSLLLSGLLVLLIPLARSAPTAALAVGAWGAASELFRPAGLAAVGSLVPAERRRSAFAVYRLAINLGMSVGPAAAGFLAAVSFRAIFWIDGATSLLAGLLLAVLPWRAGAGDSAPAPPEGSASSAGALPSRARVAFFLAGALGVGLVFFQHQAAMAVFLVRDLRQPESTYGLLFTLNTLLVVALEVPLTASLSARPLAPTLAAGALLCGLGFGALGLAAGALAAAATVVVWTFGEMVLFPAMNARAADLLPPERRGAAMGLYMTSFNLAFAVGPAAGMAVYERLGPGVLWGGCAVVGAVSAALLAASARTPRRALP